MSFQFLPKGFGGKCEIRPCHDDEGITPKEGSSSSSGSSGNPYLVPMTGYSVTKHQNFIKSQGITGEHYSGGKFNKLQGQMINDYVYYELQIDFEPSPYILDIFIEYINKDQNKKNNFDVTITDVNYDYEADFEDIRLTSFSFHVSENSLANCSASFLVLNQTFEIDDISYSSKDNKEDVSYIRDNLMPYWKFKIQFNEETKDGGGREEDFIKCLDASINWSQTYDIKFFLKATPSSKDYVIPHKVFWHIPTARFSYTEISEVSSEDDDYAGLDGLDKDEDDNNNEDLEPPCMKGEFVVFYGSEQKITCSECFVESIVPIVGNSNSYLGNTVSGFVNGNISQAGDE